MSKKSTIFTLKIGGGAGQGQQVAGITFAKACARGGLYTYDYSEYPSRIRGGLVTYQISISDQPIYAAYYDVNLLICLTKEVFDHCKKELTPDAVVFYDSDKFKIEKNELPKTSIKLYPLPLRSIAKDAGLQPITANTIAIGAVSAMLDFNIKLLYSMMNDIFASKGKVIIDMNNKALDTGAEYAKKNCDLKSFKYYLKTKPEKKDKAVITANEAIALGAIAGGCQFLASYPMTPASSILHCLAKWAEKSGMIVKQPEDEIGAVHVALGASFAGVRSMICTSGGGFALMVEGLSLAAMTETPIVMVESTRPGPATGLPTWGGQEDLRFLAGAGHGDFIRIIITPGDAKEALFLTPWAFNLTEKYQVPVIILLDKFISEGHESVDELVTSKAKIVRGKVLTQAQLNSIKDYKRYELTKDGICPRVFPGMKGGVHCANSDEHDEHGFTIEAFSAEMRIKQQDRRYHKLSAILKELPKPRFYGPKIAKKTLIGWGSVKGAVLEALKALPAGSFNFIHFTAVEPINAAEVSKLLKGQKKIWLIESNKTGQFGDLLNQKLNIKFDKKILKYTGIPFFPEELIKELK